MNALIAQALFDGVDYSQYRKIISDLLAVNQHTGKIQSESLLHYSQLNEVRMNRLDKTSTVFLEIETGLKALKRNYIWIVITEGWCGDAAQLTPIFNKMAEITHAIDLRFVLRDEHPELMELFLTNGGKSIPKLFVIDKETSSFCADWGPRPKVAQQLILDAKINFGSITDEVKTDLQLWYTKDKGLSTQQELLQLMQLIDAE